MTSNEQTTSWANQVVENQYLAYGIKILWWIAVIILFLLIAKIVAIVVKKAMLRGVNEKNYESTKKVANLISSVVFYVMILIAFFIGFEIMGINLWLLIGWISFWLWLAFKTLLGNMFAGIMILYTKEFKIWDIIEVQMNKNYFGRIEEISIRYTVIRTLDLRQVIIPNITLITVPVKTFSSEELVRLDTVIGIHYNSDVGKAIQLIVDTINTFDFIKEKENTKAYVLNLWDSAVELKCLFFFDPNSGILGEVAIGYVQEKIFEVFNANHISIPYNQTTLSFENQESKQKILQAIQQSESNTNIAPHIHQTNKQINNHKNEHYTPHYTQQHSSENSTHSTNMGENTPTPTL